MQVKKTDIRYLKGVGPKKADILKKIGINTVEDLLFYLPRRYEDRSNFALIKDLKPGEYRTIRGKVLTFGTYRTKKGRGVFKMALGDRTGVIYCVWFNQPFLKNVFQKEQEIIVYGKVEKYDKMQINHPEYEIVKDDKGPVSMGKIVPVYSLTEALSQRYMRFLTSEAILGLTKSVKESMPVNIRARAHLVDLYFSLRNIHFPVSFDNLEKAYKRIVFEEFFILQLAFALKKKEHGEATGGITHALSARMAQSFRRLLPFELTLSQERAINEIQIDMANSKPMNRLVEGDVGSGKTVVATYALLLTVQNGYQGSVMAPTEILARQHYISISELLMPLGVNVRLLVSGVEPLKKLEIKKEIESGKADIVIGTQAVIQEGVEFKNLGLAVIDEQHKFGVFQRSLLRKKGHMPDVLLMTATPIPRTLAMTVYGDLDISVIRELPKGRAPISTYCLAEEKRRAVYDFLREEIKKGRQAYIVSPRIKIAASMYNNLQEKAFPDLKLALLHGRMKAKEKDAIMRGFRNKKIDILISTTVIEVGIDIPNASIMLIENPEHFGLSQLHQLRGRIGRGEHPSHCLLLGSPSTESAKRRFDAFSETQDGFKIAEQDMEQRGSGEFFGTRQHGLPEIRFGNILRDFDIMESARKEAFELVRQDPELLDSRNMFVKHALRERFQGKFELANVG